MPATAPAGLRLVPSALRYSGCVQTKWPRSAIATLRFAASVAERLIDRGDALQITLHRAKPSSAPVLGGVMHGTVVSTNAAPAR